MCPDLYPPKKNLTLSAGIGKIPFECRRTYPCTGVHKTGASLLPQRRTRLWVACGRCTPRNATAGILLITPHRFPRFIPCQIEITFSRERDGAENPLLVLLSPCNMGQPGSAPRSLCLPAGAKIIGARHRSGQCHRRRSVPPEGDACESPIASCLICSRRRTGPLCQAQCRSAD